MSNFSGMASARGGAKRAKPLEIEIVRGLTEQDLALIQSGEALGSEPPKLATLRHNHHLLAQTLAKGVKETEASLITGYSLSRISILKSDPAFKELLAGYASLHEEKFVEVLDRMKALGLSTLDEIQERLESDPGKFSNRELFELTELMLAKGRNLSAPMGGSALGPGGVTLNVKFVSASPQIDATVETGGQSIQIEGRI